MSEIVNLGRFLLQQNPAFFISGIFIPDKTADLILFDKKHSQSLGYLKAQPLLCFLNQ
jgi:hypothetical protein